MRKMTQQKHGGNVWALSKLAGVTPESLIDFSASIYPDGSFRVTSQNLNLLQKKLSHYPDPEYQALRDKIADFHRIPPEGILPGNGSIELLYLIPRALKPRKVVIPLPSFSEYERVAKIENIPTVFLPSSKESGFFVSVQQLLPHITPGSMLILGNPASPAGTFLKKGELQGLIEACEQKGAWLIIDEAFIDFVPDSEKETQVQTSLTKKHLIIIRSFTKYFAIPGLRLGYMVANEDVTRKVSNFQPPWGVNAVSEFAGISILDSGEVNEERGKWLEKEQNYFMDAFTGSSRLRLYPSAVNFFLLELLEKKTNAPKVHSQLLKKGIIIRDCSNFRGLNDQFIRFCVRFREENRLLVESLKEVLGE